jgi:hypothetical protein
VKLLRIIALSTCLTAASDVAHAVAQQAAQTPPPASPVVVRTTPAKAEDVGSIDGIINALYASISGAKGAPRDWQRMRSLFLPDARLMPTVNRQGGPRGVAVLGVNDYIATSGERLVEIGFREREVARKVEEFGSIAHVFSTYESFRDTETTPFMRGINSIQLLNDGTRWWVVSVFWDNERQGSQIPEKYLKP